MLRNSNKKKNVFFIHEVSDTEHIFKTDKVHDKEKKETVEDYKRAEGF